MSFNPTTNYRISTGQDLSGIFQPLGSLSPYPTPTGYTTKINGVDKDLNTIFAAWTTGTQSTATGYKIFGGADLSTFFAPYNPLPYTITGGTFTKTSDGIYNYILTFTSSSSIIFNSNVGTINYTVVGGGAGGYYGGYGFFLAKPGGSGGGGGQVITENSTFSTGTTFTLTVGKGGTRGNYVEVIGLIEPTNGNSSIISTKASANGGTINTGGGSGGVPGITSNNGNPGFAGSAGTSGYGGGGGGGGGGSSASSGTGKAGGGGGGSSIGGAGGVGGKNPETNGDAGSSASNNTGGGGGGGGGAGNKFVGTAGIANSSGGNGGSGVIILKFNYT